MEVLSRYQEIIMHVLSDLAEACTRDGVEILPVFDAERDNYLVLDAGWAGTRRIHHIIAHLRIRNGKIWVEVDNTDFRIVEQLLEAGVPKGSIVLAFHSPQKRPLTEFAVA
jgi:hypothetical protein